jgi:hypothetical protein
VDHDGRRATMSTERDSTRPPSASRAALPIVLALIAVVLAGVGWFMVAMWQRTLLSLDRPDAESLAAPCSAPGPVDRPDDGPQPTPAKPEPATPLGPAAAKSVKVQGQRLADLKPLEILSVNLGAGLLRRTTKLGGQTCPDSLWAQPAAGQETSQLTFSLAGRYTRIRGLAGIHSSQPGAQAGDPSAVFRIYGDGNLLWESPALQTGGPAQPIDDVSLAGVTVLALTAESPAAAACAWGEMVLTWAPAPENVPPRESDREQEPSGRR